MSNSLSRGRLRRTVFPVFVLILLSTLAAKADTVILSDNLSNTTAGTETATGLTWLTASFGTGASASNLDSITLLLANSVAGQAMLSIYTDGGLQPGSLVGSLLSPAGYSTTLTEITFTASGLSLSTNSIYWVVLSAASGQFDWAYTTDNAGSGVGFQHTWGISDDAGLTWFTYDIYPTRMRVTATTTAAAVPEPTTLALLATGLSVGAELSRRRRKQSA